MSGHLISLDVGKDPISAPGIPVVEPVATAPVTTSVDFVIPLSPFERTLLRGIQAQYSSQLDTATENLLTSSYDECHTIRASKPSSDFHAAVGESNIKAKLFHGWKWTQYIEAPVLSALTGRLLREHDGDRELALTAAFNKFIVPERRDLFRTHAILHEYNAGIWSRLVTEPPPKLILVPYALDASLWDTLLKMYLVGHRTQFLNMGKERLGFIRDRTYDIWEVAYQFSLACRRPENANFIENHLFLSPAFKNRFAFRPAAEGGTLFSLQLASDATEVEIISSQARLAEPSPKKIDGNISAANYPLQDPRSYVEFIPWAELERVSLVELEEAHIPVSLPHRYVPNVDSHDMKWMLWKPPSNHFFDCHHLYTEDEVSQYCIENHWHLPGHFLGDRTIFAASPLDDTLFVYDLPLFSHCWTDVALTIDPSSQELFLLETIPGRQFRQRWDRVSSGSAGRLYFRNIVDDRAHGRDSNVQVRNLLGNNFHPKYQHMLRHLPRDQISNFDPEPLGCGGNGEVYGAMWKQPTPALCSLQSAKPHIAVVLKQILPVFGKSEGLKKFIRELDITFTASEGKRIPCVGLLGIATFPVDDVGRIVTSEECSDRQEKPFIVLERASEGNLLSYMERRLFGLGSGVSGLHELFITHGDLHPGNILVTKGDRANDNLLEEGEECDFLLADFGEGGYLGDHSVSSGSGKFTVRIGDYIAPEVKMGMPMSPQADTYSFGYIGQTLVSLYKVICSEQGSDDGASIPLILKAIISLCAATKRPSMKVITRQLDKLLVDLPRVMQDPDAWVSENLDLKIAAEEKSIILGGDMTRAAAELDKILKDF